MIKIPITSILSRNCGGYGAWINNPLSTPAPGSEIWAGFQTGGGSIKRKHRKSRKSSKRKLRKSIHRYKKTRRNI